MKVKLLVKSVEKNLRDSDVLARYGGEEFIVLLPKTDMIGAAILSEKIRLYVQEMAYEILDTTIVDITVSIGVSEYIAEDKELKSMIQRADEALYKAKEAGRNKVEISSS